MTNTRIIFFSILIAVLLAILVMWCADVLAHSDGNPKAHFEPYTTQDPCWGNDCNDADFIGGHGHIDAYDDENGNERWDVGEENSWGYWTCGGYKYLVPETDCSEPKPQLITSTTTTSITRESTESQSTTVLVVEETLEAAQTTIPETVEVPEPESPPVEVFETYRWDYQFYKGWNLVVFPALPEGVETIADLYARYAFFGAYNADIVVNLDGMWLKYSGDMESDVGDIPLSPHLGLAIRLDYSAFLGNILRSKTESNETQIVLRAGANLIGFPEVPSQYERPSDLLSRVVIAVILTQEGSLKLVARVGDSGDDPLVDGQAMIVIATEVTLINLQPPLAPSVIATRKITTTWAEMKGD